MKTILAGVLVLAATLAAAQDAVTADPKHHKVVFENDQMRVLLVTYGPGEKSGPLDHAAALTFALTDRKERVTMGNGPGREVSAKAGSFAPTGGKYGSENLAQQPFAALIVEFKTPESLKAASSSLEEMLGGSRSAANEASAMATLRTLNTAEVTFAATYGKGFTDGLNRMAPPAPGSAMSENRADLIQPFLAGLTEGGTDHTVTRNGYRFTYTPGPGGYGKINAYTIVAQPVQFGVSGTRSFFTDQSAIIRATKENRPANVNDPPI